MRKLLIPFLGLVLAGCSNDITTKTDLGEKYIVKESAVTVSDYSWDDEIANKEYWIKIKRDGFNSCLDGLSDETCSRIYLKNSDEQKAKLEKAKKWRDKQRSLVMIKFRPILKT